MPEILTESFCERCGTRYTFESAAPPRTKKLGRFKTLSKGLKNYVLSDDSSMDEAMAAARSDEEREVTSHQLDAFHATFNFCMTCRQYTCANCWNQAEGRCLTCAPHLGHEIMPAPFPDLAPNMSAESLHVDASAWPVSDLAKDAPDVLAPPPDLDEILAINRLARISEPQTPDAAPPPVEVVAPPVEAAGAWPIATEPGLEVPETFETAAAADDAASFEAEAEGPEGDAEAPVFKAEVDAEAPVFKAEREIETPVFKAEAELVAADPVAESAAEVEEWPIEVAAEPIPDELPAGVDDRAAAAARRTAALLSKFRPGQNIDAELAAYEAAVTAEPLEVTPTEQVAAEPVDALRAEPVWVEPEIVAAAPEPEVPAAPESELEPVAAFEVAAKVEESEPEPVEAAAPVEAAHPEVAAVAPEEVAAETPVEVAAEAPVEVAATAPVEPASQPTPPTPEPVRADRVEQPTWRIVAPEAPAVPTNGHPHVDEGFPAVAATTPVPAPPTPAEPQWPSDPQWPVAPPNASLLATRGASSSAANEALWAASARDVVASPSGTPGGGVQSCSSCGLSLSATARFCRRCGSRQGA